MKQITTTIHLTLECCECVAFKIWISFDVCNEPTVEIKVALSIILKNAFVTYQIMHLLLTAVCLLSKNRPNSQVCKKCKNVNLHSVERVSLAVKTFSKQGHIITVNTDGF